MKRGGGNNALYRLKADTTVKVRFLQEPGDWHEAYYHYIDGKFSWCSQMRSCPGCSVDNRARKIVLANAVIMHSEREEDIGKVVVMQMPTTLADQILKREKRFRTVRDRDYDLSREGSGQTDTKYSVDYDEKKTRDLSRWDDKIHDITAIVSSELSQSGESEDDDADDEDEPRSTKKSSSKNRSYDEDDEDFEDDEDEEEAEEDEDDFSELDRTELKREIKKLDPDFVAKKSQSDDDLRAYLWDLNYADDSEDEDEEEEEDEPPRRSSKKSKYDGLNEFKSKPAVKKTTVRAVRRSR